MPFEVVTIPELKNTKNLSEEQQKQAELLKLDYAKNLPRPKKKTTVADDAPPQTDVNTSSGLTEQKSTAVHKLGWHKKRAELPKRSNVRLKRRA